MHDLRFVTAFQIIMIPWAILAQGELAYLKGELGEEKKGLSILYVSPSVDSNSHIRNSFEMDYSVPKTQHIPGWDIVIVPAMFFITGMIATLDKGIDSKEAIVSYSICVGYGTYGLIKLRRYKKGKYRSL